MSWVCGDGDGIPVIMIKAVRTLAEDKRKRNPLFSEMILIYNNIMMYFLCSARLFRPEPPLL